MNSLFVVGAKLLGIYVIINGVIEIFVLANLGRASPYAAQLAASCLINLGAGTALTFFTEFVATAVRIPESADPPPNVPMRNALEVGIILLGLLQVLSVLPRAIQRLSDYLEGARLRSAADLLDPIILAPAGYLLLVLFARRIAAVLARANGHQPGA
jgi:hypothetical protein